MNGVLWVHSMLNQVATCLTMPGVPRALVCVCVLLCVQEKEKWFESLFYGGSPTVWLKSHHNNRYIIIFIKCNRHSFVLIDKGYGGGDNMRVE